MGPWFSIKLEHWNATLAARQPEQGNHELRYIEAAGKIDDSSELSVILGDQRLSYLSFFKMNFALAIFDSSPTKIDDADDLAPQFLSTFRKYWDVPKASFGFVGIREIDESEADEWEFWGRLYLGPTLFEHLWTLHVERNAQPPGKCHLFVTGPSLQQNNEHDLSMTWQPHDDDKLDNPLIVVRADFKIGAERQTEMEPGSAGALSLFQSRE